MQKTNKFLHQKALDFINNGPKKLFIDNKWVDSVSGETIDVINPQTTQQHIHNKLIEKAKDILATTNLSINEIAYNLGFEYPQSFNKLFKKKTKLSPLEYRKLFN